MGAAGDMLAAALFELIEDKEKIIEKINALKISGVQMNMERAQKCGIEGTKFHVLVNGSEEGGHEHMHESHEHEHTHEDHMHEHSYEGHMHEGHMHEHSHEGHEHTHHHTSLKDIEDIVGRLDVSDKVKTDVLNVYKLIAEAESNAHGKPVEEIHFHEVGAMDAVADITVCAMLFEELMPLKIIASPVHVGAGFVKCAHGTLPVPAPATVFILKGIPIYGGEIKSELCTPTGAALLKTFADEFKEMPLMKIEKTGFGLGKKDFERLNAVRVLLGETLGENECEASGKACENLVAKLSCNIDDMTPEDLSFASEILREEGALEVFTTAVTMKKGRAGFLLTVLSKPEDKEKMAGLIFKHTTTIGIRETLSKRYVLERREEEIETPFGIVRKKISEGFGVRKEKIEHDDLLKIAKENNLSIDEVRKKIQNK